VDITLHSTCNTDAGQRAGSLYCIQGDNNLTPDEGQRNRLCSSTHARPPRQSRVNRPPMSRMSGVELSSILWALLEHLLANLSPGSDVQHVSEGMVHPVVNDGTQVPTRAYASSSIGEQRHFWQKAKAALTPSRSAANSIHCPPAVQAALKLRSCVLHPYFRFSTCKDASLMCVCCSERM
jgi:hypothetical protein